jgi:hypothetical protein
MVCKTPENRVQTFFFRFISLYIGKEQRCLNVDCNSMKTTKKLVCMEIEYTLPFPDPEEF